MKVFGDRYEDPIERARGEVPLWRQAAVGIGLVTIGGLAAIAVGVLLSAVVSWLF